jgi:hypothetical protein
VLWPVAQPVPASPAHLQDHRPWPQRAVWRQTVVDRAWLCESSPGGSEAHSNGRATAAVYLPGPGRTNGWPPWGHAAHGPPGRVKITMAENEVVERGSRGDYLPKPRTRRESCACCRHVKSSERKYCYPRGIRPAICEACPRFRCLVLLQTLIDFSPLDAGGCSAAGRC